MMFWQARGDSAEGPVLPSYSLVSESKDGQQREAREASIPVRCVLCYLGISAGALIGTYYASVGFYQDKFHDVKLFGYQALVVLGVQFVTMLLQTQCDDRFDRQFGVAAMVGFRIIFTGLCGSLVLMLAPWAWSEAAVLMLGAVISFLATAQASSSSQLGAAVSTGSNTLVQAGVRIGGLVPVVAVYITDFSAESSLRRASCFYGMVSAVASGGIAIFAYCHYWATNLGEASEESCDDVLSSPRHQFGRTYGSLTIANREPQSGVDERVKVTGLGWQLVVALSYFCTFSPTPLFPLMGPDSAQSLVLAKFLGDALGCLTGIWHGTVISTMGHFETWLEVACYSLALVRAVATGYLLRDFVLARGAEQSFDVTVLSGWLVVFFAVGQHVAVLLDVGRQAQRSTMERKLIARRSLVMQFLGALSGTVLGLMILHRHQD